MPNVIVGTHVDTFMKSADATGALDAIGALGDAEFSTLSSTLLTKSDFANLSSTLAETTEVAALTSILLKTSDFSSLSSTLLPTTTFQSLSPSLVNSVSSVAGRGGQVRLSSIDISDSTVVGRNLMTSQNATSARTIIEAAKIPRGPFSTPFEASLNNVDYGAPYFNSNYDLKVLRTSISSVAFVGDSVTLQGLQGYSIFGSNNYGVWARSLTKAKFNFASNSIDGNNSYAFGGKRSDELVNLALSSLSANPTVNTVFIAWGINDVQQGGGTVAAFLSSSRYAWDLLRNAGKYVIQATIIPPVSSFGGGTAQKWIDANAGLRQLAESYNVPICDWVNSVALTAGSVFGLPACFIDNLHPNPYGASLLGREVAKTFNRFIDFNINNYSSLITSVTQNFVLSSTSVSTTPTGWNVFPSGDGTFSTAGISATDTGNWWTLNLVKNTGTGNFTITRFDTTTRPVSTRWMDAFCEFEVLSGAITPSISLITSPSNTQVAFDQSASSVSSVFVPSDGVCSLRTPASFIPDTASSTYLSMLVNPVAPGALIRLKGLSTRLVTFSGS